MQNVKKGNLKNVESTLFFFLNKITNWENKPKLLNLESEEIPFRFELELLIESNFFSRFPLLNSLPDAKK